jgi:hypothetical protein
MMELPAQDLPLLLAMMRERGLPVGSCQTSDQGYLRGWPETPREVTVRWSGDNGFYQRALADWMAGCRVIHRGFQSNADQSEAA